MPIPTAIPLCTAYNGADRQAFLPDVLQTLGMVANQAVDIQLKLLQVLLSILTYNQDVHDDILGHVSCHFCIRSNP
jgi:hypothetical protein